MKRLKFIRILEKDNENALCNFFLTIINNVHATKIGYFFATMNVANRSMIKHNSSTR